MIGVPPYSPGDYLDVEDDDGRVTIRLADPFRRPLQLTPAEGLALLAAGPRPARRARLGPERSARDRARPSSKPRSICPTSSSRSARRAHLDAVRDAVRAPRTARDRLLVGGSRRADDAPHRSRWWCSSRSAPGTSARTVIAPRTSACSASIASADCARPASTSSADPTAFESGEVYNPEPDRSAGHAPARAGGRVGRRGLSDTSRSTERPDGTLDVTLIVSEPAWLDRLLLRLGPDAEVVEPHDAPHRRCCRGAASARSLPARRRRCRDDGARVRGCGQ